MTDFLYDKNLTDTDEFRRSVRISVTVIGADDTSVQLNIESGRIRIPLFIGFDTAMELAAALTNAVCAYDRAAIESGALKTSETTAD